MSYFILFSGILTLFIGILALRNGSIKKEMFSFALYCFVTAFWILLNFLMIYLVNTDFLGLIYAVGTFVSASLLSWTYTYTKRGNVLWKHLMIFLIAGIIGLLSIFSSYIIESVYYINTSGIYIKEGILFPVFGVFLAGTVIFSLIKIVLAYRKELGDKKNEMKYVLIGIGGFTGFSIIVSSILPMFGIFSFTNLDSPSSLIFVIATFIALVRYQFLNIKVALIHILVSIMIAISVVEIFYADGLSEHILRTIFSAIVSSAGYMLIRSIMKDLKRKEELQEMADRLAVANEELKKLDEAKTEFVSIASHQLRTPLTSIRGFLSMILAGMYGKPNAKMKEALNRVNDSSERLLSLVHDLLNISRIESGKMVFEFKKEKIEKIIKELYDVFLPIAKEKNLKLKLAFSKKTFPAVKADASKLREAISNLIDNSIKYTQKGNVTISLAQSADILKLTVADTGIGVPKEEIPYLFEKFSRGKDTSRLKATGNGLGLYFGKKVIESHGGKVWVESEGAGKGSQFIIELPIT